MMISPLSQVAAMTLMMMPQNVVSQRPTNHISPGNVTVQVNVRLAGFLFVRARMRSEEAG